MDIIKVSHLYKSYGPIKAVKDVSFVVKKGELFAFLGINGAGKSTTINIISGSLSKDSGDVFVDDQSIEEHPLLLKETLGIVFQNSVLDKNLTVRDNLKLRAGLYGMPSKVINERIKALSGTFELDELLSRKVKTLSGGQRRRVDIARALIHEPKVLIMDEPTTGLDPQTRNLLWEVLTKLRHEGLTVFLTTHYMEEAASADYVIIIDEGKIATKGTPHELKEKYARDSFIIYRKDRESLKEALTKDGYTVKENREALHLEISDGVAAKALLTKYGAEINDFEFVRGDMNSVFLNVTGKELRGA